MRKKNILLSAGGTATAWHLSSLVFSRFSDHFNLFVCDINPPYLVPASQLAHRFIQVPPVDAAGYRDYMLSLFSEYNIHIYVPLIDADVYGFCTDDPDLERLGVFSASIPYHTSRLMHNKRTLSTYLEKNGLPVPRTLMLEDMGALEDQKVFVKPEQGFGSHGARAVVVDDIAALLAREPGLLVQSMCYEPEITVEVFNHRGMIHSLCRERLETKAGVCTKARIWVDTALHSLSQRLCAVLDLPEAFCFQVMAGEDGTWLITDVNPRLGAGTALSTAYGWSLASAALACWGGIEYPMQFLHTRSGDVHVVRVLQERVME